MKNGKPPVAMNATPAFLLCSFARLLALTTLWLAPAPAHAADIKNEACLECHGEKDAEPFIDGSLNRRNVTPKVLGRSTETLSG